MRSAQPSPFEVLLGDMAGLPEPVRRFHSTREALVTRGRAEITQSPSWKARLLCLLAGLPRPGRDVPCSVVFSPLGDGREHWARDFAGRSYKSVMRASSPVKDGKREPPHLVERFGPFGVFDLHFKLTPTDRGLEWNLIGWDLLGHTLPPASVPRIACLESGDGARFRFDIDVAFPVIGHVITYSGWLAAEKPA